MPMGVTNGNAAFERMLENLLEPVRDCADPVVDGVIIASRDARATMSCRRHMRGTSPECWTSWCGTDSHRQQ